LINTQIVEKLKQVIGENSILSISYPRERRIFITISNNCLKDTIEFLKQNDFSYLSAITGSQTDDNLIELLYHLDNSGTLITIRIILPQNEASIPTITDLIIGASLYEREIHDLFGVKFEGHPELNKLILPDEWQNNSFPLKT
jgi:NADH:ubiquinone oxidoreductase subunit C